ncbi:MAG: ABC transporter ATP-binding protein [Candidatus Dadabacteria bacterium]|nr:MAG: ABC transporter ATP-binding protein [Candidatus Dadabacteria bacterium]
MLSLDGIHTHYGMAHILSGVSLEVRRGEVVALLGRNGAGKTTTLKTVMGLVRPTRGTVRLGEKDITGWPPYRVARAGVGYVPEDRRIFTDLTVRENLEVGRRPPREGCPVWDEERVFRLFPALKEMRDRPGGRMSGGEQQMLTIGRTLMGNPSVILLDEPSEGLAPVIVEQMARAITELKREGLTVLLSEQNLPFCSAVSDRAYIIEKGIIRYEGPMRELLDRPEVLEAYLSV